MLVERFYDPWAVKWVLLMPLVLVRSQILKKYILRLDHGGRTL
jgi:hypothetical protein